MSAQKKKNKEAPTPVFRQFKPRDVYEGVKVVEEQTVVSPQKTIVKRYISLRLIKTDNEALDIWLENINRHGFRDRYFHAAQMNIDAVMLRNIVHAFTGMHYADFIQELTYIVAKDLMTSKHCRYLNEVSDFLGYKAYSSLFRLIKQKEKRSPTGHKRMSYEEQMKEIEEIRKRQTDRKKERKKEIIK